MEDVMELDEMLPLIRQLILAPNRGAAMAILRQHPDLMSEESVAKLREAGELTCEAGLAEGSMLTSIADLLEQFGVELERPGTWRSQREGRA
jgi:DNA-binding transcriptional ArsR family regulator